MTGQNAFELLYSNRFYSQSFYNGIHSSKATSPGQAPHWLGARVVEYWHNKDTSGRANIGTYEQMLPCNVTINDSIQAKMTGFYYSMWVYNRDLLKSADWDLFVSPGLSMGRLRLYGDSRVKAKNVCIAPQVAVMPRVLLGNFTISLSAAYGYDLSETGWRKMGFRKGAMPDIQPFRQTCFALSVGAGYCFR